MQCCQTTGHTACRTASGIIASGPRYVGLQCGSAKCNHAARANGQVPIAHPSQVGSDPAKWDIIQDEGLGGFTGVIPILNLPSLSQPSPDTPSYTTSMCTRTSPPTAPEAHTIAPHVPASETQATPANEAYAIDILHSGPEERRWAGVRYESEGGEEVGRMVRGLWDERGWECLWVSRLDVLSLVRDHRIVGENSAGSE